MRRLDRILPGAIEAKEVLRAARAKRVLRRWSEIVGADLAARAQPDRYESGVVYVAVEGSAWAQELRLRRDRILNRLNELSKEPGLFADLKFGIRKVIPPPAPPGSEAKEEVPYNELSIREIAERRLAQWSDEE
jgi:predicted nucleic acid-binding Zn ribbon protein